MFVKRVIAGTPGQPGAPPTDPDFAKKYPALWEYLSLQQWEDGKNRKLATLSLSLQEGRWCVCMVDKESNRLTFLSGTTHSEVLRTLEKKLADETVEWRACKQWNKK